MDGAVEEARANLEKAAKIAEGATQISPIHESSFSPITLADRPPENSKQSEFHELLTNRDRDIAQNAVVDFFAAFPTIPLEGLIPFTKNDGSTIEMPVSPLRKRMMEVGIALMNFNGIEYSQGVMKEVADTVITHRTGDVRLPGEVDGKWTDKQVNEFKLGLVFTDVVPEDYANVPFAKQAKQIIKNIGSTVRSAMPSRDMIRQIMPPDLRGDQKPPTTSGPTPPSTAA